MPQMPAVFLSHGAPPLVDDALWVSQLAAWADELPRPSAILMVSAHWEAAPLTIGSTDASTPLTYDFWGFPARYSDVTYAAPGAVALASEVEAMSTSFFFLFACLRTTSVPCTFVSMV